MEEITNLKQANKTLSDYLPKAINLTKKNVNLDRMIPLMKILGNPEKKLKVIHIAGTSGKTSTAYFISELLRKSGFRVGLTISPYIDNINERVQINNKSLSENIFCRELTKFLNIIDKLTIKPSYFELLCAFAYWIFEKEKVDYAVIETGLGGLLDATNVAQEPDKLCVVTDIGYDHMHILGNTIEEIAFQKAGIIHKNNPVVMYKQDNNITDIFKDKAKQTKSELILLDSEKLKVGFDLLLNKNLPEFQKRNWLLAYRAYKYLSSRDNFKEIHDKDLRETQDILIPARMEVIHINNKIIIMDGAHNEQKMTAFLNSFKAKYPKEKPSVLIALKHDKDYQKIIPLFNNFTSRIITTNFNTSQDLLFKSIPAEDLATDFIKSHIRNVSFILNMHKAYLTLISGPEKICVITGSFYLISQLRKLEKLN